MSHTVAVIGAGGMGVCHARHLDELQRCDVAWIVDPDEEAGVALANEVGALWTPGATRVLAECDGVVVASPDRFHADHVGAALAAGAVVFCEKPLTESVEASHALVAAELEAGERSIQMGFMREFDAPHRHVAETLVPLGELNHLRCVHRNANTEGRSLRDILLISLIHDIHSARFLSRSEIVSVHTSAVERGGRVVSVVLTCRLANGAVAILEFDDAAPRYEVIVEASAELGMVSSTEAERSATRSEQSALSDLGDDWFTPFLGAYRLEIEAWLDSMDTGEVRGPSAWDGYVAQVVVEAALASASAAAPATVELLEIAPIHRRWP